MKDTDYAPLYHIIRSFNHFENLQFFVVIEYLNAGKKIIKIIFK